MATPDEGLEITISTPIGVDGIYWRITNFDANRRTQRVRIVVKGWQSFDDYDAGLDPLPRTFDYTVAPPTFNTYFDKAALSPEGKNVIVQSYAYLLAETAEFAGATLLPSSSS